MNEPKTYNIFDILKCCKITVPIIQRDYVQGIDTQEINEKRLKFLDYLCREDEKNLDFIYGYTENGKFIPIDGQQRLTTLFLMLIYGKIFKHNEEDNKTSDEKCGQICNDRKQDLSTQNILKNFTYELRTSTREFLERLIDNLENLIFNNNPSHEIKNQSWFLGLWEKDPSISAMLNTLDDIHGKCKGKEIEKMVGNTRFRFWDLQKGGKFNDPEDVFIKMNSRGMPLTPFQEFKAWLNKKLDKTVKVDKENDIIWPLKMDTDWMDFFWELAKVKNDNHDLLPEITERMFLKFINELIFFYHQLDEKEWREYILSNVDENFVFYQSQYEKVDNPVFGKIFSLLNKLTEKSNENEQLAEEKINNLIKSVNIRINFSAPELENGNHNDQCQIENYFSELLKKLNDWQYRDRAYFYGIITWLKPKKQSNKIEIDFKTYFRTLRNLIENTTIGSNNIYNIKDSITNLTDFINELDESKLTGFDTTQKKEENRKLKLIYKKDNSNLIKDENWETLLLEAENHWYLAGQVGFLLDYAENKKEKFEEYWEKFRAVFDLEYKEENKNYNSPDENYKNRYLLRRSLLTYGEYMPHYTSNIYTFNTFNTQLRAKNEEWRKTFIERKDLWIQFLDKKEFPKGENGEILEEKEYKKFMCSLIENFKNKNNWRFAFIHSPFLFDMANNKQIRKWDHKWNSHKIPYVFLNRSYAKKRWQKKNDFRECYLNWLLQRKFNLSFSYCYTTENDHCLALDNISFNNKNIVIDIRYTNSRKPNNFEFRIYIKGHGKEKDEAIEQIFNKLEWKFEFFKEDKYFGYYSYPLTGWQGENKEKIGSIEEIEKAFEYLKNLLRKFNIKIH